ncbi:MAG: hypothetical protein IJT20_05580 [Synergistaceae bacterium]|nr:hypothetical protein [Synergistaceae bacterium]
MSFIIKRVINNATYIYEVTSYRDKQGRPRNKQKCLGRFDEEEGVLFSSKRKLPSEIKKIRTITTKIKVVHTKKKSAASKTKHKTKTTGKTRSEE